METHTQLERPGDMGKTERERRLVLSLLTPSRLEARAEFSGKTRTTAGRNQSAHDTMQTRQGQVMDSEETGRAWSK